MEWSPILISMGIPSAVSGAVVGLGFWLIQRKFERRDEGQKAANRIREQKQDEKDKARKKNEILLIKSVVASLALGEATACAIRDGKCNGEMTVALDYAKQVKHEHKDFLAEQGVENLF